jgi:putative phage-type endonuclease
VEFYVVQIIQIDQRTQDWYKLRKGIPTASAAHKIVTGTGCRSTQALRYMGGLLNERQGFEPDHFGQTDAMARGITLESEARIAFEQFQNIRTEEVGFVLRRDKNIGCSPDGLICDSSGRFNAGLEIKCPLPHNHSDIFWSGVLPTKYKPQVHASMAITGLRSWWFMSYCPGEQPLVVKATWNAYTDLVKSELNHFISKLDLATIRKGIDQDWREYI